MEKESFHYTIKLITITMLLGTISSTILFYVGFTMTMILAVLGIMSVFIAGVYINQIKILRKLNREEIDDLKLKNPYPTL